MHPRPTGHRSPLGTTILTLALLVASGGCSSSEGATPTTTTPASTTAATSSTTAPPSARGSDGCGSAPAISGLADAPPHDTPLTLSSGGVDRTYRLAIPDTYDADEPAPLVLDLHGAGSNAFQQSAYSGLPAAAAARGFITVTPDAVGALWELRADGPDDDFLDDLVTTIQDGYCVDLDRVHVAGISLGAWKASAVACGHADRYASIALVAEDVHPADCPPMPVIAFHGTADRVVPYGEGSDPGVTVTGPNAGLPGARSNLAAWAEAAGCAADPDTSRIGDDVERWSYPGCDPGTAVDFYTIFGGGHSWPGADIVIGPTTQTIDATGLALDFFEAHPRR